MFKTEQDDREMFAFWRARLDEDEQKARAATEGPWRVDDDSYAEQIYAPDGVSVIAGGRWGGEASVFESTADALHIVRHDPDRVLRDVAAARARLELLEEAVGAGHDSYDLGAALLPLELAAYDKHPAYKDSWRP